jgi:hypothetical protein
VPGLRRIGGKAGVCGLFTFKNKSMNQHTIKAKFGNNGKIKGVTLTQNGETKEFAVSRKGKVFDGHKQIGILKRERLRWFDNQFKIVFSDPA